MVRSGAGLVGLAALAMAGLSGCGGGEERIAVHPVSGKVEVKGEPAGGAFVVFHPIGATPVAREVEPLKPSAQVKPDGSFELTTYDEADGAPAGEYTVTVEWRKLRREGGDMVAGPNVVPEVYSRSDKSPLRVAIGGNATELDPIRIGKK